MFKSVLEYVLNSIPYMLCAVPVVIVIRIILFAKNHSKSPLNIYREIAIILFTLFCVGVASQTIIPKLEFGMVSVGIVNRNLWGTVNLIPGKVFFDIYRECVVNHYYLYFIINFLGNIGLFMPIGFGIPLLWKNISLKKLVIIAATASLFIEVCQLPQARGTDIDDIWINTLGAVLGYFIYIKARKITVLRSLFHKIKTIP